MTAYNTIHYAVAERVARITLARPDRLNAITAEMLGELGHALDRAVAEGARAILLTGEGRAFCSGADLGVSLPDDLGLLLEAHYNPVAMKIAALPIPLVTAVNGVAAGAGCSLALMGDFVIAARSSYFLLAFVNIGLVPDFGGTWLVARNAGRAKALEMMLLGERVSAGKAEAWGMIYSAVDDADLLSDAVGLAQRLARGPTQAMGMIRRAVGQALTLPLAEVLRREAADQRQAGATADFAEGVAAIAEKRSAKFVGK
ncbi:2-(1,2-epoxy-1,2-dihydrophenyl)acetyl-CoA isomerase [Sphingomonas glacialis]|uniref:2-(1,2-epoxy-1,2-dihydrophenyl)acetyl-CoA isomerase n=1 Tax=Sphingomonas glacialis TaxID=658225 RepID=A0ABQ3LSF9_9SPHN|nr:enoyl-CoA hydratase-related protein [Sphingomonas glacialis]GHH24951.1 2-(1,2-epoxy-1,2-dihydrophenyl)acetyl-CoA isomerase [Sphingomonas glacialis]